MADPKSKSKAPLPAAPPSNPDIDLNSEDKWWLRTCGFPRPHSLSSPSSPHPTHGAPPPTRLRAILSKTGDLWPNASVIPVIFVKPSGTAVQREKVRKVAVEWERWANIKFSFVSEREMSSKEKGEGKSKEKVKEKVTIRSIRVMFDESEGPWSLIARAVEGKDQSIREPTMNLGNVTKDERIYNDEKGVILHEFGHALGFLHEHQSIRRGERITLIREVIVPFYKGMGWKEEDINTQILDVYEQDQVSNYSEVDLSSVMMYFMPPYLNKEKINIRPINQLSDKDKAFALLNYPFTPPPPPSSSLTPSPSPNPTRPPFPDTTWTLDRALDIIGFPPSSSDSSDSPARQRIIAEFDSGDWDGVRLELGMFTLNARAAAMAARILGGVAGGGGGVDGGVSVSSGGGGEVKAKL